MSQQVILKWNKPPSLAEFEREQRKDEPHQSGRRMLAISVVLHALAICAVWIVTKEIWMQEDRIKCAFALAAMGPLIPLWGYSGLRRECLTTESPV